MENQNEIELNSPEMEEKLKKLHKMEEIKGEDSSVSKKLKLSKQKELNLLGNKENEGSGNIQEIEKFPCEDNNIAKESPDAKKSKSNPRIRLRTKSKSNCKSKSKSKSKSRPKEEGSLCKVYHLRPRKNGGTSQCSSEEGHENKAEGDEAEDKNDVSFKVEDNIESGSSNSPSVNSVTSPPKIAVSLPEEKEVVQVPQEGGVVITSNETVGQPSNEAIALQEGSTGNLPVGEEEKMLMEEIKDLQEEDIEKEKEQYETFKKEIEEKEEALKGMERTEESSNPSNPSNPDVEASEAQPNA